MKTEWFSGHARQSSRQVYLFTPRLEWASWLHLLFLLFLVRPVGVQAEFFCVTNNGALTVTQYTGPAGSVTVPATIYRMPVVNIGAKAFAYMVGLTNITLADTVTNIGAGAFSDCVNLMTANVGKGVACIGERAFFNCAALDSVSLPDTLANIGQLAFYDCGLTNLAVPTSVTNIGTEAFSWCTKLASVTIATNVVSIGDYAFHACSSLSAITVDARNPSYSSVEGVLFDKAQVTLLQCPGAKDGSYAVPNSVRTIATAAFVNCNSLTNVTIPYSVTNIGDSPFGSCASLSVIEVDSLNPCYSSLGGALFNRDKTTLIQCPAVFTETYSFPRTVTNIEATAFMGCKYLAAISAHPFNPSYSSLDGVLFNKDRSTLVQFPAAIGGAYEVPATVSHLRDYAFVSCSGLTSISLPGSIKDIGLATFAGCSGLTNIVIPDGVNHIGPEAFEGCTRLTQLTLGKGLTNIGVCAFYGCSSLSSVFIPNGVTSVADRTFQGCSALSNVTIGRRVTNLGAFAFGFCTNLAAVYFTGNAPVADSSALGYEHATVYYLPGTTGWTRTLGGMATVLWDPHPETFNTDFGVKAGRFGFSIAGASNLVVVIEACTNSVNPVWFPLQTNQLSGGSTYFEDPLWSQYPLRFYRLRSP